MSPEHFHQDGETRWREGWHIPPRTISFGPLTSYQYTRGQTFFRSDEEVMQHVRTKAGEGSPYHIAAIAWLILKRME